MPVAAIRKFMLASDSFNDAELSTLLQAGFSAVPPADRRHWLGQTELSLDGYGGVRNVAAADRVRRALRLLEAELPPPAGKMI
jgi:hypothetical protein